MGKTVKKLHSQRRHHERVAVSVLPETREQVYARVYKGVSVECVCGKTLNLEELATGPYPFRCPGCGKRVVKRLWPSVWESLPMSLCSALAILVEGRPSVTWRGFVSCRALVGSSTAARCMSRIVGRRSELCSGTKRTRPLWSLAGEERGVSGAPGAEERGVVSDVGMGGDVLPLHGVAGAVAAEDGVGRVGEVGLGVIGCLLDDFLGIVARLVPCEF